MKNKYRIYIIQTQKQMNVFLIVLYIVVSLSLIGIILLQNFDKVENLTSSTNMNKHKESNIITKTTIFLGILFMCVALIVAIASKSEKNIKIKKKSPTSKVNSKQDK